MSIVEPPHLRPMIGDPDDHRPNSRWALIVDPGDGYAGVTSLGFVREVVAVGDAIPLHTHDVDEAITILAGTAETRLGDERRRVGPDTVIFIPAGTPHGTANAGEEDLHLQAVYPATTVEIAMLERNAAPGTEDDAPRTTRYDLRTGAFEAIE